MILILWSGLMVVSFIYTGIVGPIVLATILTLICMWREGDI